MGVYISELYNKRILTLGGRMLGDVQGVMLNMEEGRVSHLLLNKMDNMSRSSDVRTEFIKHSVAYKRVRKVSESIVVSDTE